MNRFLKGLLLDADKRCQVLQELLRSGDFHQDLRSSTLGVYHQLERLHRAFRSILDDPAFGDPLLLRNQLQEYKRLAEQLSLIESYPIPFITRYDATDHELSQLCAALIRQINHPLAPPLVAAFSNQYYWTVSGFNFICIPAAEGQFLLGMGDLCHELGHILLGHREREFTFNFLRELLSHIRSEQDRVRTEQRPPSYYQFYDQLFAAWKDRWTREFIADIVAAYMAGPAYAWQHLRLCAQMTRGVYDNRLDSLHPSDESRMRAILAVLRQMGHEDLAGRIAGKWNEYVALTGDTETTDYRLCYPEMLINSLVNHTLDVCHDLGVRPFINTISDEAKPSIIALLDNAWDVFLSSPESYPDWESQQIEELFQLLQHIQ